MGCVLYDTLETHFPMQLKWTQCINRSGTRYESGMGTTTLLGCGCGGCCLKRMMSLLFVGPFLEKWSQRILWYILVNLWSISKLLQVGEKKNDLNFRRRMTPSRSGTTSTEYSLNTMIHSWIAKNLTWRSFGPSSENILWIFRSHFWKSSDIPVWQLCA
jgi:hypothetical protein